MKKYICSLFKKIYIALKSTDEQKALFKKLQKGDMVWAKMPLSNKELEKIEEKHRIRPYLIVEKNKNYFICYQSSSKSRTRFNNYEEYFVNKYKYNKKKDSWIDLTKTFEIPMNNIKSEYIRLDEFDIREIEKRLSIEFNRGNKSILKFCTLVYINVGNVIIKDNKLYYVYSEDNIFIYCIRIQKKKHKNSNVIIINKKTYYADFNEKISIKRNEKMKIINIANNDETLIIESQMNNFKNSDIIKFGYENKKKEMRFDIGTVLKYGNSKIMYLYSENNRHYGIDMLWYAIKPRIFEIKDINKREIIEIKKIDEVNKILECLVEKNVKDRKKFEKINKYVRSLLYYSIV